MSFSKFVTILLLCASSFAQISGPGSLTSNAKITGTTSDTPQYNQRNVSFTHNILPLANPILIVGCAERTWPYQQMTGAYVNGVPMIQAATLNGIPRKANVTVWYLTGVPSGQVQITATSNAFATNGYGPTCTAQDYYGVDRLNPVELVDTDNVPVLDGQASPSLTCTFTPQKDGDEVVMFEYSTGYNQTAVASASPAPADISSGRWFGLQIGVAHSGLLSAGVPFSETWQIHNSATGVAFSAIGLILRAQ